LDFALRHLALLRSSDPQAADQILHPLGGIQELGAGGGELLGDGRLLLRGRGDFLGAGGVGLGGFRDLVQRGLDVAKRILETVTLATDQGSLDVLQIILGVGRYEHCLLQSMPVSIGAVTVRILGLEALIRAKETAARGKDLKALPELREALVELSALRAIHRQRRWTR
jgi:hypothetical protein